MRRAGFRVGRLTLAVLVGASACGGDRPGGASAEGGGEAAAVPEGVYGTAPVAMNGIPSVIVLTPAAPTETSTPLPAAPPAPLGDPVIDQFGLAFSPTRLLARPGVVHITNSESALSHNVHVRRARSGDTVFNDDAGSGETIELALAEEGGYDVMCDMHPGMTAFVFLTDAPYAVLADDDGSFALGAVPAGDYLARVWTAADGFHDPVVLSVSGASTEVDLLPTD